MVFKKIADVMSIAERLPKSLKKRGKKFQNFPKMQMNGESQSNIYFAEFELDTAHRQLLRNGKPISLYAKTFDLLTFLLENNGRILSKDEILEKVWEGQFVEEANLSVQISALRKALGEKKDSPHFLVTVPGKGYKFVADIQNNNNEIVIEKHKISRVLVEEETEIENSDPKSQNLLSKVPSNKRNRSLILFVVLVLFGLVLGLYQYFRVKKIHPPFEKIKLTRLTNNGKIEAAAASPDGKFIAYVLGETEGNSLWVRQTEAANDIRLVSPVKAQFWDLDFTPDGKQIYYNLFAGDKIDPQLFRIPTLGGVSQLIPNIFVYAISFAPDGKHIAYIASDSAVGQNYLMVADADGANRQIIARKSYPNTFFFDGDYTAWSPDGETIVCLVNHLESEESYLSIVGISVKDGTEKLLSERKWSSIQSFELLKDGSGMLVSGSEKKSSKSQIWFVPLPSGEIRAVTDDFMNYSSINASADGNSFIALQTASVNSISVSDANNTENTFEEIISEVGPLNPFVWTPDGKIVFRSTAGGVSNLWIMDADGVNHRQLTADAQVDEHGMCLTPNGKFIFFTSWRSGKANLWRVDADGKNLIQLTNGEADANPVCTPDGQSVIYQRGILTQQQLWKVSINGGEPVKITDFRAKWGAISTDGKQISFFQMNDDKWTIGIVGVDGGEVLHRLDVPGILREKKIQWSPDNRSLFFIGANGNVGNIWSLPLDGSLPKQMTNFNSYWLTDFSWSPDGKKVAVARSLSINDMVLITEFSE